MCTARANYYLRNSPFPKYIKASMYSGLISMHFSHIYNSLLSYLSANRSRDLTKVFYLLYIF